MSILRRAVTKLTDDQLVVLISDGCQLERDHTLAADSPIRRFAAEIAPDGDYKIALFADRIICEAWREVALRLAYAYDNGLRAGIVNAMEQA